MTGESNGPGLGWLILAKVACCGGLLLAASGAVGLASIAGWFMDGGFVWLAVAVVIGVAAYAWRRRGGERSRALEQGHYGWPRRGA